MEKTPFAGYTDLDPGESLSTDGFSFQSINPQIADFFAKLTVTHRHTGEAAMAAPVDPLDATIVGGGGTIPSDLDLFYVYTLLDDVGGETLASPAVHLATPGPIPPPGSGPTLALDYTAGVLTVGTYYYVLTYVDADGHETTPSPYSAAVREPGHANARVLFSGLNAFPTGAVGWRLYKSTANAPYRLVGTGAGATFVDDGNVCADCVGMPPTVNRTGSTSSVSIVKPTLPAGATGFRIYVSSTGAFTNPALVGSYAPAVVGPIVLTDFSPDPGVPPTVPTAVGGASLIDPDTELIDFPWKRPVADAAALPAVGNTTGDVRITLDDLTAHIWLGAAWGPLAGDFRWKPPVADAAALPAVGNTTGDVRITLDDFTGHIWNAAAWQAFGGGGGGGSPQAWQALHLHDYNVDGGAAVVVVDYGYLPIGANPAGAVAYYKGQDDMVHLRGVVHVTDAITPGGTAGFSAGDTVPLAHLPAGYRPAAGTNNSSYGWAKVDTYGSVQIGYRIDDQGKVFVDVAFQNGSGFTGGFDKNSLFVLDGISFRAES